MLDQKRLMQIANMAMPFGKYQGRVLIDLPEEYLLWFQAKGFPPGILGELMGWTLQIKMEGLDSLVRPLKGKKLPEASD